MSTQPQIFSPPQTQIASAPDRMGFTLFMALLVHLVIILGVGFELADRQRPAASLEIALAQYRSEKEPDKADFLAQANQQGSGEAEQKKRQTSPLEAQRPQNQVRQAQNRAEPQAQPQKSRAKTLLTSTHSPKKTKVAKKSIPIETSLERKISLLEKSLEIASLEAQLATQIQFEANKPKVRTISAASTKYSIDAYYMDGWRKKVELIGNLNYPKEARRLNLFGSLRMLVAVLPDGSIKEVRILKSSGKKLLDDAAIRIVRLAAPFAPFPDDLRKEVGILQIIRTWKFQQNLYSSEA